jgi:hypothetical protein
MMPPHTFKRSVQFEHKGRKVTLHVLAYREIDDGFFYSCVADWVRSQGRKKMTSDMEITFPTLYGA